MSNPTPHRLPANFAEALRGPEPEKPMAPEVLEDLGETIDSGPAVLPHSGLAAAARDQNNLNAGIREWVARLQSTEVGEVASQADAPRSGRPLPRPLQAGYVQAQEKAMPKHPIPRGVVTKDNFAEHEARIRRDVEREADEFLDMFKNMPPERRARMKKQIVAQAMAQVRRILDHGEAIVLKGSANDADTWIRQHAKRGYDLHAIVAKEGRDVWRRDPDWTPIDLRS